MNDNLNYCVYEKFKKEILGYKVETEYTKEEALINKNVSLAKYICFFVFFTNLFWVFRDFIDNNAFDLFDLSSLIALFFNNFMCIVMYIITKLKDKVSFLAKRISLILYFMSFMWLQAAIIITRYQGYINLITDLSFVQIGIALSSLYLFIPCFLPLPDIKDSIIILVSSLIAIVIPAFTNAKDVYPLLSYLIFYIYIVSAYLMFRYKLLDLEGKKLEVSKLNNFLGREAYFDDLSECLNRRAFKLYWDHLINNAHSKVGLAIYDVDFFKSYNEYYSHIEADTALKGLAKIANEKIELRGHYVFRMNSEQFIIIYEDTDEETFINDMKDLRQRVYDENLKREDIEEYDRLTISLGCIFIDASNLNYRDNSKALEQQLYIAKCEGKNAVAYNNKFMR